MIYKLEQVKVQVGDNLMTKSIYKKAAAMTKNLFGDEKAQVGTLYMVFFAAIIVLAIIIIFTFIPGIGSTVEQSTPTAPAYGQPGGDWNSSDTANPNAAALKKASGAAIWTSTSGILLVAVIIGIVVIILAALFGIFRSRSAQPPEGGGM